MRKPIAIKNLQAITFKGITVITSELLANVYGSEVNSIQVNYSRNKNRFIEGKHYFKLQGKELAELRLSLSKSQNWQLKISTKARVLMLWTERGAARHAKMLETEQAWEVFERLEDHYFSSPPPAQVLPQPDMQQLQDIAAKSAKEHELFKAAPKYRQEARDYVCNVLEGIQAFAHEHNISMADWVPVDRDKAASGLLADLLHGIRAELTFNMNLEPQFKLLPAGAVNIMPTDPECMKAIVERVVSHDVLTAMMQAGISRLSSGENK